ncbi:hypothetical protein AB5J62_15010 [Amycolatopsis sp. cg5]|uniref:hypothetical protein n=1 Tax=Amycolatopsis sp. cg5 TaxID=3238802 RepID=UPI003525C6EB
MPPRLTSTLSSLGVEADRDTLAAVQAELGGSFAALTEIRSQCTAELDAGELEPAELTDWLLAQIPESAVRVAWVADGVGATMSFTRFAENVDDLWYPAIDDIVIVDDTHAVLVLDHEERFTFTRRADS